MPDSTPPHAPMSPQAIMFRIYCGYRILLCSLLVAILLFTRGDPIVGGLNPDRFGWICTLYGIAVLILLVFAPRTRGPGAQAIFANLFFDIGVLTALAWDPLESTCRHASLSIL